MGATRLATWGQRFLPLPRTDCVWTVVFRAWLPRLVSHLPSHLLREWGLPETVGSCNDLDPALAWGMVREANSSAAHIPTLWGREGNAWADTPTMHDHSCQRIAFPCSAGLATFPLSCHEWVWSFSLSLRSLFSRAFRGGPRLATCIRRAAPSKNLHTHTKEERATELPRPPSIHLHPPQLSYPIWPIIQWMWAKRSSCVRSPTLSPKVMKAARASASLTA